MSKRYITSIDGREALVEIESRQDGRIQANVTMDGEEVQRVSFEQSERPGGSYQVLLDDSRVITGRIMSHDGRTYTVTQGKSRFDVKAIDEMESYLGGGAMDEDGGKVTVSMPGRVVKILVSEGDSVEEGQPLLIVEAMKMENEVKAGRGGTVERIAVAEGESVEADATLMEIGD